MPSIEQRSKNHLKKMVEGAGRSLAQSRTGKRTKQVLNNAAYQQIMDQIKAKGKTIQNIPIELIQLHENIRETYDDQKLSQLASSLREDGLIQFPTLCIRKIKSGQFQLICRNGHRRILAAKKLGWKRIECTIIAFETAKAELYHTINANLREDVFYLDLAQAYQDATDLGESDQAIAERVGVNVRTVGWYRRLTEMAVSCQRLCRQHPELFNATWAIKLARSGPIPASNILEPLMHKMIAAGRSWQPDLSEGAADAASAKSDKSLERQKQQGIAKQRLVELGRKPLFKNHASVVGELLQCMAQAGYLTEANLKRLQKELLEDKAGLSFVKKSVGKARGSRRSLNQAKA